MDAEDSGIYFDHHASTPVDERVVAEMEGAFDEVYGNPASRTNHRAGQEAHGAVAEARERVVDAIGATRTEEVIFTSGATESDNLALKGVMREARDNNDGSHLITAATEHEAVLEACDALEDEGFDVTVLPVDEHGRIDPADLRNAIRDETVLVSIMAANNEVGTVAPLEEIGEVTSEEGVLFHTDAVQAVGYVDLDVDELGIDLMSLSGHKIYGPKGVGALYVRYGSTHLEPLLHGGGHERGWRSGTLNVPGIVGLGKAVELAEAEREQRVEHVGKLRDEFEQRLRAEVDDIAVNGHPEHRLPNNLNVSFVGADDQRLVARLNDDGLYAATGSACSTMETRESHVLTAMLDDEDRIQSSVRFGLGKDNTETDVERAAEIVSSNVGRLRQFGGLA
jgi:cysteine desulfurase